MFDLLPNFVAIIINYLLLIYEFNKTNNILKSRDISLTYCNFIANKIYVISGYLNYCFFKQIKESKNYKDKISFFVFFKLKGIKKFVLCDSPKEFIKLYIIIEKLLIPYLKSDLKLKSMFIQISLITMILSNLFYFISFLFIC